MIIAGIYSFNGGKEAVQSNYAKELREIRKIIAAVDSAKHKTKISKEKTMPGKVLYRPGSLNAEFDTEFEAKGWRKRKIPCEYPTNYYTAGFTARASSKGAFREMDFIKNRLGIEVQFGKYSFMVYNVCAKMTIFHKMGLIEVGVEIVPVKAFTEEMSTGVSYFEQFVWDLEHRGMADIDIPVLILGIAA